MGDEPAQALAHIQHAELRPKVHQAVGGWRAGQPHDPPDERAHLHQAAEALGLMGLEGRKLVDHHHVVVKRQAAFLDQPLDVLPVDDVDISFLRQGRFSLSLASDRHRIGQVVKLVPLLKLCAPSITGHTKWSDDQHLVNLKAVEQQVQNGGQGDARLAKAHVQQHGSEGMVLDVVDCVPLVLMRFVFHQVSLQSAPGHQGHTP